MCTGRLREPLYRLSRAQLAVQARLERPRRDCRQHPNRLLQTDRYRHHAPHRHSHHQHPPGMGETIQPLHGERPGTVAPAEPDRRPPPEEFRRGVRQPLLRGCLHHARSGTSHGGDQRRDGLQTDTEMLIFYIFATKIIAMQELRSLTPQEIERLQSLNCECANWTRVKVSAGFNPHFIKTPVFTER